MGVVKDYEGVKDWSKPLVTVDGEWRGEVVGMNCGLREVKITCVRDTKRPLVLLYRDDGTSDVPGYNLINAPSPPPVAEAAISDPYFREVDAEGREAVSEDIASQGESPDPGVAPEIDWHTRLQCVGGWLEEIRRKDGIRPIYAGASKVQLGPDAFRVAFKGKDCRKETFHGFERWSIEHKYASTPFTVYCDVPNLPVGTVRTEVVA